MLVRFRDIRRPNYQGHHLIPLQAVSVFSGSEIFDRSFPDGFLSDDFESNGILLPCSEEEALRSGRPLHRGPHPRYNELVIERIAMITRLGNRVDSKPERRNFFKFKISSLQSGLRRALLSNSFGKLRLNRRDPIRTNVDFQDIDARIDQIWAATKNS